MNNEQTHTIKKIVHVSDFHIAERNRFGGKRPSMADFAGNGVWGLCGHKDKALKDLAHVLSTDPFKDALFVFTGDLTAFGLEGQFSQGFAFLNGQYKARPGDIETIGVGFTDWPSLSIPGNHDYFSGWDHWISQSPLDGSPNPRPRSAPFKDMPRLETTVVDDAHIGRILLQFVIIDSDADVWIESPNRRALWNRRMARGRFVSQITNDGAIASDDPGASDDATADGDGRTITICLLHHSPIHRGNTLEIDDESFERLSRLCGHYDVKAALCGHMHKHGSAMMQSRSTWNGWPECRELRCGTTLQEAEYGRRALNWMQQLPADLVNLFVSQDDERRIHRRYEREMDEAGKPSGLQGQNSFLVHNIECRDGGRLWWRAELWSLGARGFRCTDPAWQEFAVA